MLIFSFLLQACQISQPIISREWEGQEIHRTQEPDPDMVGFAKTSELALDGFKTLAANMYNPIPSFTRKCGDFLITGKQKVGAGWILGHKRNGMDQEYVAYFKGINKWTEIQRTLERLHDLYDYRDQRVPRPIEETLKELAQLSYNSQKNDGLVDVQAAYRDAIDEHAKKYMKQKPRQATYRLIPNVHYEPQTAKEWAAFRKKSADEIYQLIKQKYETGMRSQVFLQELKGYEGGWEDAKCFWVALSAHPTLFQEIIDKLWKPTYGKKPNVTHLQGPQIASEYKGLGVQLTALLGEWILNNKDQYLYTDVEGARTTVGKFITSLRKDSPTVESYVTSHITNPGIMLWAELYDLLSILLRRKIISVYPTHEDWLQQQSYRLNGIKNFPWRVDAPDAYVKTVKDTHHYAMAAVHPRS